MPRRLCKHTAISVGLRPEGDPCEGQGLAAWQRADQAHAGNDTEINELAFCIEAEITREDRYRERMRVAQELDYQQSMAALRTHNPNSLKIQGSANGQKNNSDRQH
jgi:hypothetical protein